ncbi:MAG: TIM barrel protein [Saprospiraceae bacterium]|nr:TIM barrel protein [Saprospiraceae bacterium]
MATRRDALKTATLGLGAMALTPTQAISKTIQTLDMPKHEFKHSVCRWCFNSFELEEFAERAKEIGISSIELLSANAWKVVEKYGITCALGTGSFANIAEGYNNPANHDKLQKAYLQLIDQAADAGIPQVIVFSGNRKNLSDETGIENCAKGLDKVVKHAEQKGVMVVMELLNSKVDHKDYQCDKTPWGAALVDKIGSPQFKLLYDIYHMQIMEGDVIATVRKYKDYISHFHTAGVPGRHEINDTQELNYKAIMKAIVDLGFKGYVAQEFIPVSQDKIAALKEGVDICSV